MDHFKDHIKFSKSVFIKINQFEQSNPASKNRRKKIFQAAKNGSAGWINIKGRSIICVYYLRAQVTQSI
jgi:hypothetical protein